MLRKARATLRKHVPDWLNVEVNRHFYQNLREALAAPASSLLPRGPHWRRIAQVYAALDLADEGATYTTLIQQVQDVTGTGCSRKLIAKWKHARGLR